MRSFKDEGAAYRAGKLLAAVLGHEPSREYLRNNTKAQYLGTNKDGGALVPDEWAQTIINLKERRPFGIASRYCGKVQMTSDSLNVPRRTGGVAASFVGDGVTIPEGTATFDNVQLTAKKMAAPCVSALS